MYVCMYVYLLLLLLSSGNRYLVRNESCEPVVEMLLRMGGDPNSRDSNGCTPLTVACMGEAWSICCLLMEAGGDLNIPFTTPSATTTATTTTATSTSATTIITTTAATTTATSNCVEGKGKQWGRPQDLLGGSRAVQKMLYGRISAPQSAVPPDRRDRCMHCTLSFEGVNDDHGGDDDADKENGNMKAKATSSSTTSSSSSSTLSSMTSMMLASSFLSSLSSDKKKESSAAKFHCSLCARVVCETCASYRVTRPMVPAFLQEQFPATKIFTVCALCYAILKEKKNNNNNNNNSSSRNRNANSNYSLSDKRSKSLMSDGVLQQKASTVMQEGEKAAILAIVDTI